MLVGHSGVGKSTLVNALVPDAHREVGIVNAVTGRGRHTSTSAYLLELPDGDGWIIDTPGIRSFGLAHVQPENLIEAFPDLDEMTENCPRGCTHGTGEPECGLDEAVAAGEADPDRVESFRRLLAARSATRLVGLLAPDGPGAGVAGQEQHDQQGDGGRRPAPARRARRSRRLPRALAGRQGGGAAERPGREARRRRT